MNDVTDTDCGSLSAEMSLSVCLSPADQYQVQTSYLAQLF